MTRVAKERKKKTKLIVVFDTNVLYTKVANDLVRNEIKTLVSSSSNHDDIEIVWFIPESVINERRWQMEKKASELLPSMEKLESLLGHKLGISKEILSSRIDEAIKRQMSELRLSALAMDARLVDWGGIIHRSIFRLPPFEDGEKEKGFRDAIIGESFVQIVESSPITPSVCRVVLVTGDKLLSAYVEEKTKERKNVRILSDIGELESLINALDSEVTEEYVSEIQGMARDLFFTKDDKETVYYKEDIYESIKQKHPDLFGIKNDDGCLQEFGTWWINAPIFMKKEKQRITWVSPIEVEFTLYKFEPGDSKEESSGALGFFASQGAAQNKFSDLLSSLKLKRVDLGSGRYIFEVEWAVTINQNKKLISPSVLKIKEVGSRQA